MGVITISRGAMMGGEELAQLLAQRLGYKAIDREVINECARKYNIIEQDLLNELEKSPGLWQRLTRARRRDLIFIQCSLIDAARRDNIVYYGHAGSLLLAELRSIMRIRLEGSLKDRVAAVMKEQGVDRKKAIEFIEKADKQKRRWVKLLYDEDLHNPALYDLVFNTQIMSLDTICDVVESAISHEEFKTTDESLSRLNDVSLACEVKAAIASDDRIWDQPITVNARNGVVNIDGAVKDGKLGKLIKETAWQVKGVKDCAVNFGVPAIPADDN